MATQDPRYVILNIIRTYVTGTPITLDDGVTSANDLHLYERGPEGIKELFYDEDYDVLFIYGEPTVRSIRQIQDIPVHFLMSYPVTVATINKYDPLLGSLIGTSSTLQAKARIALRAAVAASAQSGPAAVASYIITVIRETGRTDWMAGINLWRTEYIIEYTTG